MLNALVQADAAALRPAVQLKPGSIPPDRTHVSAGGEDQKYHRPLLTDLLLVVVRHEEVASKVPLEQQIPERGAVLLCLGESAP
jgi:hypothetical protein